MDMIAGGSEQEPEFLVGEAASLEPLRLAIRTAKVSGGGEDATSIALKELLCESRNEKVLMSLTPVILSLQKSPSSSPHGEYDDDGDDQDKGDDNTDGKDNIREEGDGLRQDFKFQKIEGNAIITTERFLFISNESQVQEQDKHLQDPEENKKYDLSIDAQCIHLHAQSEDPEPSIYLQIVEGADADDDDDQYPTEVTIIPISQSNDDKILICETLFSRFSELLSLNPISPNDYGDQQHAIGGMMMEMMGTAMGQEKGLNMIAADDAASSDDEMIIAAPAVGVGAISGDPHQFSDCEEEEEETTHCHQNYKQHTKKRSRETEDGNDNDNDPGATTEERAAMLERLDSLLVVKPELEIRDDELAEDQFADAEEPSPKEDKPKAKPIGQFDDAN